MQLFQGTFAVVSVQNAGVAWWAHIGGFVAGFAIAWLLKRADATTPAVRVVRPNTERPSSYRVYVRPRQD